jgi:arylsulfatase A-like enzyme
MPRVLSVRSWFVVLLVVSVVLGDFNASSKQPKFVVTMLIDDCGFYDLQVNGNKDSPTPTLGALASEGQILDRHYVYKVCSPTRRMMLSGRFTVHITGSQAKVCSDYLPLNFTLLSGKMKQAGFMNHFVGKGHLGYQSEDHLPVNRGFDSHVGYLYGMESYCHGNSGSAKAGSIIGSPKYYDKDFWENEKPAEAEVDSAALFYSTNFYANRAVQIISNHSVDKPLWLHLTWQAVHAPYDEPPTWEQTPKGGFWDQTFASMLQVLDSGVANVTAALKTRGMWNDTLLLVSSDNGGPSFINAKSALGHYPGNNYPLRGMKGTPW